jgi:hypothetical protein
MPARRGRGRPAPRARSGVARQGQRPGCEQTTGVRTGTAARRRRGSGEDPGCGGRGRCAAAPRGCESPSSRPRRGRTIRARGACAAARTSTGAASGASPPSAPARRSRASIAEGYLHRGRGRLRLVVRACTYGPEASPGLRGLDKLIVVPARSGPRLSPPPQPRARWSRSAPGGRSRAASPPSAHPRARAMSCQPRAFGQGPCRASGWTASSSDVPWWSMPTRRTGAAFVAVGAVAAGLAACGNDEASAPVQTVPLIPAVAASPYVASPTVRAGSTARLFTLPGLGRFRVRCRRGARAEISYRAARRGADQLVTTEHRLASSNRRLKPGSRIAVGIGRRRGPLVEWRIAFISEGRIEVATAVFRVGLLPGGRGCFVSGTAEVGERRR